MTVSYLALALALVSGQAAKPTNPAVWRLKVVVFTRTESDARDTAGVLRERRGLIETPQNEQIRLAILRLGAYVSAKFDGAVSIEPDVTVESEWMRDAGAVPFGPDFARRYLEARINGGFYDAEDKVFRGPYNSVIYVLPGSSAVDLPDCTVNDTPVAAVCSKPLGADGITQSFDSVLRAAWLRQVEIRAKQQGYGAVAFSAAQPTPTDGWASVVNVGDVPAQAYKSHLATTLCLNPAAVDPPAAKDSQAPAMTSARVGDSAQGQVLKVTEKSAIREGSIALPAHADGSPAINPEASHTFSFSVKSTSQDPIAIRLQSSQGKFGWVSVGRDAILAPPVPACSVIDTNFVPDGKWHKLAVDLRPLIKAAGLTDVDSLSIEPSPNCRLAGKMRAEPIEYEFGPFAFSADPADPAPVAIVASATDDNPEARAMFAAQAKGPSAELAALLKDKSDIVRLNAATAYIGFKDRSVEEPLISDTLDLDPLVAAASLRALMAEGSDTAIAVVRRSIHVSLSDYAKGVAAKLIADTHQAAYADDVSTLIAARSWEAHVTGVEAIAELPKPQSQTWMMAYIGMADPAVKLAVTRNADPAVDGVVPKLLWSAVNEPSDMVRAESYIKLIEAPLPTTRAEGYKGVRDDSRFVRRLLVEYLIAHPIEENRNALRIAVADRSDQVRAAAIEGFAALDKGAATEEIANVLDDPDWDVQLALIDLSKRRSLKLPQKTVDAMLASPDKRVVDGAKGLGH